MARARSSSGRSADVRWTLAAPAALALSAGQIGVNVISATSSLRETLLRIRGEFMAWADGTQAPGASANITAGMIVVPEGTGTTVTVSPLSDSQAPWLWYEAMTLGYEEYVTDVVDCPILTAKRVLVDNKAMRILRPKTEVQLVVENTTLGAALTVNVAGLFRFLLQD